MGKKIWLSMHPRNFVVTCSHVIVRPSVDTRGIQCKIHVTQSTGMATQIQIETFWREIAWPPAKVEKEKERENKKVGEG